MDLLTDLNKYFVDRKWCQVLSLLHKNVFTDTALCSEFISNNYVELFTKCHLGSLTRIVSLIREIGSDLCLVNKILCYFDKLEYKNQDQEDSFLIMQLNSDILNYKNNNKAYEYLNMKMPEEAKEYFFNFMFLYYENSLDYSNSYKYLINYINIIKKKEKNDYFSKRLKELGILLAEIALRSENIYSFDGLLEELEESELKSLLMAYNNGDIKYVNEKNHGFPKEKVFLIALVKLTVYRVSIPISEIQSVLSLNKDGVLFLIFKSLGKGLLNGYYDGKKEELILYKSINKSINDEEIKEMKYKFNDWRNKVSEIIESI